jgi:hypothetical protein
MSKTDRYSDEELMTRLWDTEEIKKLVYKRGYYIANEWRAKELDELWVSDPDLRKTASMGKNTGWYVGMDAIRAYYVEKHLADRKRQLAAISAANPAILDCEENLHIGCIANHPATTGLVEIAGDGKTAKALFYSNGQETQADPDGTATAMWVPQKQAYDLVKEDGQWKIWHLTMAVDSSLEAGGNFSETDAYTHYDSDPIMLEFGTPTIPCITHDATFNWWDNYPPRPLPYETWSDELSYGPEGYKPQEYFAWKAHEGGFVK